MNTLAKHLDEDDIVEVLGRRYIVVGTTGDETVTVALSAEAGGAHMDITCPGTTPVQVVDWAPTEAELASGSRSPR